MSSQFEEFNKRLPIYLDSRTPIICVETFDSLSFMEHSVHVLYLARHGLDGELL